MTYKYSVETRSDYLIKETDNIELLTTEEVEDYIYDLMNEDNDGEKWKTNCICDTLAEAEAKAEEIDCCYTRRFRTYENGKEVYDIEFDATIIWKIEYDEDGEEVGMELEKLICCGEER